MIIAVAIYVLVCLGVMVWAVTRPDKPDPGANLEHIADLETAKLEAVTEQLRLAAARLREEMLGVQVFEARQNAPTSLTLQ